MEKKMKDVLEKAPVPKAHSKEKHSVEISDKLRKVLIWTLLINGVSCVCLTEQIYHMLPYELGILMILTGIVDVWRGFRTGEYKRSETKLTSNGILYIFLGIIILCSMENAYFIICSLWGTLGIIKGSEELNRAICKISQKTVSLTQWVSAIVEIGLGIMLFIDPVGSIHHHIVILGLELIMIGWEQISAENNFFKTHHLYWLLKLLTIIMICWILKDYRMIIFTAFTLVTSEFLIRTKKQKIQKKVGEDTVVKNYKNISMALFYVIVVNIIVFPQMGILTANRLLVLVGIVIIVFLIKSLKYYNSLSKNKMEVEYK